VLNLWSLRLLNHEAENQYKSAYYRDNRRVFMVLGALRAAFLVLFSTLQAVQSIRGDSHAVFIGLYAFVVLELVFIAAVALRCRLFERRFCWLTMINWLAQLFFWGLVSTPQTLAEEKSPTSFYSLGMLQVAYNMIFLLSLQNWHQKLAGALFINCFIYRESTKVEYILAFFLIVLIIVYQQYSQEKYQKILFYWMFRQNKDLHGWKDLFHYTIPEPVLVLQTSKDRTSMVLHEECAGKLLIDTATITKTQKTVLPQSSPHNAAMSSLNENINLGSTYAPQPPPLQVVYQNRHFTENFTYTLDELLRSSTEVYQNGLHSDATSLLDKKADFTSLQQFLARKVDEFARQNGEQEFFISTHAELNLEQNIVCKVVTSPPARRARGQPQSQQQ
jgi:hypothetical protein